MVFEKLGKRAKENGLYFVMGAVATAALGAALYFTGVVPGNNNVAETKQPTAIVEQIELSPANASYVLGLTDTYIRSNPGVLENEFQSAQSENTDYVEGVAGFCNTLSGMKEEKKQEELAKYDVEAGTADPLVTKCEPTVINGARALVLSDSTNIDQVVLNNDFMGQRTYSAQPLPFPMQTGLAEENKDAQKYSQESVTPNKVAPQQEDLVSLMKETTSSLFGNYQ
ncbi:hypothetical protein HN695_07920 [Candidatus Woesearchaeota archaeon]|jgi:hypothetical protein|nr:hypothetical protein [Candidatus Woesearchaeota archaeon]MBT5272468.1 hypothetical protein [Candidatus Woesearchaeota archaeon]MBT6041524.1 hypothetical protein [Candidatus Woesearchaeota archaeon]MBT6336330.1 hypothetical protein [Candidatus Woesearchaeota archaeon]MBT7928232.1 hypothetical protein [Candidatus Woesearchaeota archaeon]